MLAFLTLIYISKYIIFIKLTVVQKKRDLAHFTIFIFLLNI